MSNERQGQLGIFGTAAKHVGASVGTTTALGKKIAGASVDGLSTMGGWLSLTSGGSRRVSDDEAGVAVQSPPRKARPKQASRPSGADMVALRERERLTQDLAAAKSKLEKAEGQIEDFKGTDSGADTKLPREQEEKLAALSRQLQEARDQAEKAQATLSSQLGAIHSEKESLLSDLEEVRAQAEGARSRTEELSAELSGLRKSLKSVTSEKNELQSALERERAARAAEAKKAEALAGQGASSAKKGSRQPDPKAKASTGVASGAVPPEVTPEEAGAATFAGAAEKVSFARAVRDSASENTVTRVRAAQILGSIPHGLSVRALLALLARDASEEVRKECVNSLSALGMKEGLPAVERALADESGPVRLAAVRGVYQLAGRDGAPSLIRMFSDELHDVQRRAAACLGWLGQSDLAVELAPLLRRENASVRLAALEALGNLRSQALLDDIIGLLEDPEESVGRKAFEVLHTVTGRQMGRGFPSDEEGLKFLVARWRAWREESPSG